MSIFVTGGNGFIGTNFILDWLDYMGEPVINLDVLSYAANLKNLASLSGNPDYTFIQGSINDYEMLVRLFECHQPRAVINFAAQTHVDRSIFSPAQFIENNVVGTFNLLEAVKFYWNNLSKTKRNYFRFIHISTDEVFGSLCNDDLPFDELSRYQPNNPYSASKASSDHLVRAWHNTYNLPTVIINSSNNYGPYHFPEKLIPLCILNALSNKPLSLYGDGQQTRDWLYVKDHCAAIRCVLEKGVIGETYNVGGWNEKTNLSVVEALCEILDDINPRLDKISYKKLIVFIKDRPGHDKRYSINSAKIQQMLGWRPRETFENGLRKTVVWFLANQDWLNDAAQANFEKHYL